MRWKAQGSRHRKPGRTKRHLLLRTGVTGGVIGTTLVVTTASSATETAAAPADTVEYQDGGPRPLALAATAERAADATRTAALTSQLEDARTQAANRASRWATRQEAERRAEEARQAAEAGQQTEELSSGSSETGTPGTGTAEAGSPGITSLGKQDAGVRGSAASVVDFLQAQLGKAYILGAAGPHAYDCSSLTQAAFRTIGVDLPRTSQPQSATGRQVSLNALKPGDILYWGPASSAYHVAVYIGNGSFIGAQNPSDGVTQKTLSWDMPDGAVRVLH